MGARRLGVARGYQPGRPSLEASKRREVFRLARDPVALSRGENYFGAPDTFFFWLTRNQVALV